MNIFTGRILVLATMHGKEKVIAPILEKHLGVKVVIPKDFDTDQFGTFTRDKERTGNQLNAAQLKLKKAMSIVGTDLGVASEGSFGSDSNMLFVPSNLELILLVDKKNKIEIRGHYKSFDTNFSGQYVKSVAEASAFAKQVGFPEHAVIVRRSETSKDSIYKGITTQEELEQRVNKLLRGLFVEKIYLETDMRAHMNPARMKNIEKATEDLIKNIQSECPDCKTPGFVIVNAKTGLPCSTCMLKTKTPLAYIWHCQKCNLEKEIPSEDRKFEDPIMCDRCNP